MKYYESVSGEDLAGKFEAVSIQFRHPEPEGIGMSRCWSPAFRRPLWGTG